MNTPNTAVPDRTYRNRWIGRVLWPNGPPLEDYGIDDYTRQPILYPSYSSVPVPEPKPTAIPEQTTDVLGAPGSPIFSGFVRDLGEYNSKLAGNAAFQVYEQMRRSDADVRASLLACKLPIRAAQYQIVPGAAPGHPQRALAVEIADFVRDNLFGGLENTLKTGFKSTQRFESVLENALLALDFGCSGHEILWTIDGDKVRIRRLSPRLPITYYRFWVDDDGESLLALEQYGYRKDTFVNVIVPSEKLDYFCYDQEGANFYGRGLLRAAYTALSLDTPVPTPSGWKSMEELREGDQVFDERGRTQNVIAKSEIWKDRPCYRVTFGDGTSIIADKMHLWQTETFYERNFKKAGGKIRTTEELFNTQFNSYNRKGDYANHSIVRCEPIRYPHQDLPVDPYVLGAWLGDGDANSGRISTNCADEAEQRYFVASAGYTPTVSRSGPVGGLGRVILTHGLVSQLKSLGVYGNKHVPEIYLRGDVTQRKDLLSGLMDSDGSVAQEGGQCVFANVNRKLIDGIVELLRSVGESVTVEWNTPNDNHQPIHIVRFTPMESPFKLERKTLALVKARSAMRWNRHRHYIQSVEKVEPRDTVCIEVDGPSRLFLAGLSCVPTHNSWYIKNQLYRIDAISLERNGLGAPVMKSPVNLSVEDKKTALSIVQNFNVHEQTGFVLPPGWEFEIVGIKGGRPREPYMSIRHHSEEIVRSVLAMFISFGTSQTGARASASVLNDFFMLSLNSVARLVTTTMNVSSIRRLVDFNYGDYRGGPTPYPQLVHSNIVVMNPLELAEKIKDLSQWQTDIVQPDDETENWFRSMTGMPLKSKPRTRFMPVQQRIMEQPAPGETPESIEQGVGGIKPGEGVAPIHPAGAPSGPLPVSPAPIDDVAIKEGRRDPRESEPGVEPRTERSDAARQIREVAQPFSKSQSAQMADENVNDDEETTAYLPTIYWIRHASTDFNAEGRMRPPDAPLSSHGIQEAHDVAAALSKRAKPKVIYSSSLKRAMDSASIISDDLDADVIPMPELATWNSGELAGKRPDDIQEELRYYDENPQQAPSNGEAPADAYRRAKSGVEKLERRAESSRSPVVAITHHRILSWLPSIVNGDAMPPLSGHPADVNTGEVVVMRKFGGRWRLPELSQDGKMRMGENHPERVHTVAVDFDGVLAERADKFKPGFIGKPIPKGIDMLHRLMKMGVHVVIFTARPDLDDVEVWLRKQGFDIQATNRKPPASSYIDDRAIPSEDDLDAIIRRVKQLQKLSDIESGDRMTAREAGYIELPGAVKDADCKVVNVDGGVSSDLGCCNAFRYSASRPKAFKCGTCKHVAGSRKFTGGDANRDISRDAPGAPGDNSPLAKATRGVNWKQYNKSIKGFSKRLASEMQSAVLTTILRATEMRGSRQLPPNPDLERIVGSVLAEAARYGRNSFYDEREAANGKTDRDGSPLAPADIQPLMSKFYRHIVDCLQKSQDANDAIPQAASGDLYGAAREAVCRAMAQGRLAGMSETAGEIASVFRSEAGNGCQTCGAKNGYSWPGPQDVDWLPGSDGCKDCRGTLIADFK